MSSTERDGQYLQTFGLKYRLRVESDSCDASVIFGSRGNLYEYGPSELGLMILSPDNEPNPRLWALVKKSCLEAGMILRQNGDGEGAFSFDCENRNQAKLAIKLTGVRPKKQISAEHKAKLLAGLREHRRNRSEAILGVVSAC